VNGAVSNISRRSRNQLVLVVVLVRELCEFPELESRLDDDSENDYELDCSTRRHAMGKYDHLELQGNEREEAVQAVKEQIAAWGITMPDVTPLPLHFGLGRFRDVGETEFWVANEVELGYCGKFLFVFDGQTCPYHYHKVKHETFFLLKGTLRMRVGDEERVMEKGDLLPMPPGLGHSFTGIGPALILEVSMPSTLQDNFFENKSIGDNGVI